MRMSLDELIDKIFLRPAWRIRLRLLDECMRTFTNQFPTLPWSVVLDFIELVSEFPRLAHRVLTLFKRDGIR